MNLTLEIGPNLYLLGKYILWGLLAVYIVVQYWIIRASSRR